MLSNLEKKRLALATSLFLALISLPYIYAALSSGPDLLFGGFLLNPIDGNTYLAKMRQGFEGAWQFTLPYSAEAGDPAPINLYYLFLGHVARWLGAPLILVFHAARLVAAVLMLRALYALCAVTFSNIQSRWYAFLLASFGSGLGWVAIFFGLFTPDFWVSEMYPFLTAYTNAHFPLGLALQIYLITHWQKRESFDRIASVKTIILSAVLALVYPFGLVLVGTVIVADFLLQIVLGKSTGQAFQQILLLSASGGVIVLYQYWIVVRHPVLSIWNAQNLTPTPPALDMLISLSPAILLAFIGATIAWKSKSIHLSTLFLWILLSLIVAYMPINVQRRMLTGIYIPLSLIAIFALEVMSRKWQRGTGLYVALAVLSIPTILLVLISGLSAVGEKDQSVYFLQSEIAGYTWLDENTSKDDLLMAAPANGLLAPAYSSVRVLYGHPFETVNANKWLEIVSDFYAHAHNPEGQLQELGVDFVLYGAQESALGEVPLLPSWQIVFEEQGTQIFAPKP
jgi:hypothetical protein